MYFLWVTMISLLSGSAYSVSDELGGFSLRFQKHEHTHDYFGLVTTCGMNRCMGRRRYKQCSSLCACGACGVCWQARMLGGGVCCCAILHNSHR